MMELDENETAREEGEELSDSVSRGPRHEAGLTVLRGPNVGAFFPLGGGESVIGRSPELAVPIPDDTLSRRHASVRRVGNAYTVQDLDSTNGTFVDGEQVEQPRVLEDGCRIFLGNRTVLHFRLYDAVELEAARRTHDLTLRDPLTGLFNRRHLQEQLASEVAFARRHVTPVSLLLLDVDHFKQINDRYGHGVGDAALKLLADEMRKLTREEDLLARHGGEEFALLLRGIGLDETLELAERIRESVASRSLEVQGRQVRLTVSVGVAHSSDGQEVSPQELFEVADRALYASKDAGRNRVSLAPEGI